MLQLYNMLSQSISQALMIGGDMANKGPYIKAMRTVKKEILKILSTWISKATNPQMVFNIYSRLFLMNINRLYNTVFV